ncbi:DUF6074 family protein [Ciceribacter sp. RN22]|uniref:DUF6074 family protein n=1 Tax=Ciceribacter sp. RN22 TaxID=2954932 RepID=UPI002093C7A3|nr:DUF6074 family protein [Ciceribacter sp. RN22]MCO6180266.1 DUF6074 family protein [Ciceribacter sp. RN22]
MTTDLPLFSWLNSRQSCDVLAFPQSRRIGKARQYAATAYRLEGEPKRLASYRLRMRNELLRMLHEGGVDDDTALSQALDFDRLIDREIDRLKVMDRLGLLPDERGGAA